MQSLLKACVQAHARARWLVNCTMGMMRRVVEGKAACSRLGGCLACTCHMGLLARATGCEPSLPARPLPMGAPWHAPTPRPACTYAHVALSPAVLHPSRSAGGGREALSHEQHKPGTLAKTLAAGRRAPVISEAAQQQAVRLKRRTKVG